MVYLTIGCRCLIAVVFLAAAAGKIRNRRAYAAFVAATARFLPTWLPLAVKRVAGTRAGIHGVSAGVLAVELAIPALLAVPAAAPAGFALAAVVLAGFIVAIGAVLARDERIVCACFATSTAPVGPQHLVRNGVLLAAAVSGLALPASSGADPVGALLAVVAAAVGATLLIFTDDLVELFR
ncbi:MauE/DoxX family redox-associated membrane protein [Actinoplanes teichomyceticus]|uniref:Methylamine utilisation protein MauE domain-containing protein n=1 Tax=Actinoplanes teichomyceticus TaxID=1867 RepID=A0A561VH01_ACTTI|nr:MauE/DoxX family redox-associated membrane protein [Actinoplanes teichomyceticus]TWG10881.1 hypothetical protein FHX34_107379 [Actinoplanes teichomyceticus]GIF12498.1 hypothetical protein Ate01nite_25300 [Actinoplanes teichomyceticus]